MSDQKIIIDVVKQISKEFAKLLENATGDLEKRQAKLIEESEKRHVRTEQKIDKLIDTLTENTMELRDTRKDQEHIFKRQERIEQNQKEQGEKWRDIAEQILLMNERQKNASTKWEKVNDVVHKVLVWIIVAALAITFTPNINSSELTEQKDIPWLRNDQD